MALLDARTWESKIYIDGWVAGSGGTRDVIAPANGEKLGRIGIANGDDVRRATTRAASAQVQWAAKKPEERAAVLRKAGALWEEHAEELHVWIMKETGAIPAKAALETHIAAGECFDASALPSHTQGDVLATNEERWSFARRRPAGVVTVIAPFNFPLILAIRSVAPALALGNAVILKPDPRTGVSGGVALVRIFEEAGLPAGVLQLLQGGADVGEASITAPEVRVVSFTGSTAAGRRIGEIGGRHLKRTHLELGGNNALIILPGADLAKAASAGAFGSFLHQGQICMTTGRHLVHESLHDSYVTAMATKAEHLPIGDPASGTVAIGPLIDSGQLARVDSIVKDTVAAGARLAAGGTFEDLFYKPTVLADVQTTHRAWSEEIFGPVAPILAYSSIEEAIEIARDVEYGLTLGILGEVGQAMRIADAVPSGIVHINGQTVSDEANAPFGGVAASGTGSRFGGSAANIEAFTETQWLTMRPEIAPYPF
ncbi:MAG: aldehyde dehydrogenase family protein [Microbacteriaceae bacterium]|jgi:benzaldehyde dehydrogenase (NAD)|nr:aldehyde dehydrogenase family protein [Microbacteriaceae bacterium]